MARWPAATDAFWSPPPSVLDSHINAASNMHNEPIDHLYSILYSGQPSFLQQQHSQLSNPATHHHHSSQQGCLAAFSIVFLGEFGDKTFFTAALLAVRVGRLASFTGSMLALGLMSLVGVAIGSTLAAAPPEWSSGWPVGEILGVLLLVTFGVSALRKAAREAVAPKGVTSQIQPEGVQHIAASSGTNSSTSSSSSSSGTARLGASSSSTTGSSGALTPQHSADAELAEAEDMLAAAASRGLLGQHSTAQHGGSRTKVLLRSVLEVAAVMFLAEWGDRSMLATVALGAAQNPWGVAIGASAAYAAASGLAVLGGAWAAQYVSEQTLDAISGLLFLLFAAASLVSLV